MTATTPVKIEQLENMLEHHPDREFVSYLVSGLKEGFHTMVENQPQQSFECKNLLSARENPLIVDQLINSEVEKGFLKGPFHHPPFDNYRVSPLGVATGKYSGKKRLIVDLSSPHDNPSHPSINECIDKEACSLTYVKLDDAIKIISSFDKPAWLCKADISDAFKLIPIHPDLWHLYCVKWRDNYYVYVRLVFGSRSSPVIFDKLSQAICWIAKDHGIQHILHLLDDFLTIDDPECIPERTMAILTMIFKKLGIPLAWHKTEGPVWILEYLGIILDTILRQARLPKDKLDRIIGLIGACLDKQTIKKRDLLSLLGHLNFATRVVIPGRSFVAYLISLTKTAKELHHYVTLNSGCRMELKMWHSFLRQWNGLYFFLDREITKAIDMEFFTDASGSIGFGAFYKGQWFQGEWPDNMKLNSETKGTGLSIALLELYPIVVAALVWGHLWHKKRILVHCDNSAVVDIINKGRSRCPQINVLMRKLSLSEAEGGFMIYAEHIEGRINHIADSLSRFQMQRFREVAPHASPTQTPIPSVKDLMGNSEV